jgi:pyruvate dehydrogenase E2 component (dihydrolipoamide acetyltransferase)
LQNELTRLGSVRREQAMLARAVAHQGFQQIDVTADVGRLGCPTCVVFGTSDRVLDWRDVANLPSRVAIHLVRRAGHLPQAVDPELVVRLVAGDVTARTRAAND